MSEQDIHTVAFSNQKPKDPRSSANIISRLFLIWADPLFWLGCHRPLEQKDLYAHPREADSEKLLRRFNRHWQYEVDRRKHGKKPRLLVAVMKCFWHKLLIQGLLLLVEFAGWVSQSVLLGYLTELFDDTEVCTDSVDTNSTDTGQRQTISSTAYLYAAGIAAISFSFALSHGLGFLISYKNGMVSRIVMTGAIYQKILSLSQVTVGQLSIGHIVNLASNDVQRLDLAFVYFHSFLLAPIHLVVVTYLIYVEIGWYSFIMTAIVCLQVPLQLVLAKLFNYWRLKSAKLTDSRVRIMNEVITGIRVIKMYAWEYAFKRAIARIRKKESALILKAGLIRGAALAFMIVFVNIVVFITFSIYVANGGQLTSKKVFTTISLLLSVRFLTVYAITQGILGVVEAQVASKRLQKLLEFEDFVCRKQDKAVSGSPEIVVSNVSVSWSKTDSVLALTGINFTVNQENRLLAIVGPVGCGKSTLLQSLLNELEVHTGSISIDGSISYASQEPWVFSATLRENVIFGQEYDRVRYERVLRACALGKDVDLLVNGDLTLVGERGVTLSGGQKARVNLARAVYRDADIYLLDDPLSAVDSAVGKHIFNNCIQGLLKDKLVVLVTHQVHFATLAKKLLVLNKGEVEAYDSYSNLITKGFDTTRLIGLISTSNVERNDRLPIGSDARARRNSRKPNAVYLNDVCTESETIKNSSLTTAQAADQVDMLFDSDNLSIPSMSKMQSLPSLQIGEDYEADNVTHPAEESLHGTLSSRIYFQFFQAGGIFVSVVVFLIIVLGEVGIVLSEWWLSNWALCDASNFEFMSIDLNNSVCVFENSSSLCSLETNDRIYIYTALSLSTILASFARAFGFVYICVNASRVLHNRMFGAVLRSPVLFFDTNPIGRVLNRFSKDVGFLDDLMPYVFFEFILFVSRSVAIFLTTLVTNPWVILPVLLIFALMLFLRWYYLKTSREVKRLEAIARSPVYSHISTTLQGLPVIRAFGKQAEALRLFHEFHNQHSQGWYFYLVTTRWLGIRIDVLSATFVAVFMMMSIGLISYVSELSLVGLGITYAISLSGIFQYAIRLSAEVENLMVSGERVIGYSRLESEASLETVHTQSKPSDNWPDSGSITVSNISFQYSSKLPTVLHDVSFFILPSEKIGIVGRTGAGKSSLISVLYRLAEFEGQVTIDGVDIQSIGLHDLRKKMSIIPQDPVLFSGTVKYNLDPFDEYSDMQLWKSLEQVQLSDFVSQMEGQLHGEVLEGGSNFSVGQRQLVCLARALLRKNKILILDEATANVDPNTDRAIQEIIREAFTDCTVLTIAHRLNTVMDSDRILVMKDGRVAEFDSPLTLLNNKFSELAQMVEKTGPENASVLYQIALNANKLSEKDNSDIMLVSAL